MVNTRSVTIVNNLVGVTTYDYHVKNEGKDQGNQRSSERAAKASRTA